MHLTLPPFSPPFLLLFLFTSTLTCTHHAVQCGAAAAAPAAAGVEFLDPTLPPVLPTQPPRCSVLALYRNFAAAAADPAAGNSSASTSLVATTVNYTQPEECPAPWTRVILELSVSVSAGQKDHTGAVWIAGVEVLRTRSPLSTATPAFWTVHKDITRYSAAIRELGDHGGAITVAIERESNRTTLVSGVFAANLSLHFYRGPMSSAHQLYFNGRPGVKGLYREPADMIIPISRASASANADTPADDNDGDDDEPLDSCKRALWFRINDETDTPTSAVTLPPNTYRAVLEIFASYHGDEELWYTNPLQSSYEAGRRARKLNGGLRQVFAMIDGKFAGGRIPFPVIYPGSVNPYYWSPVAAIGAFDMPSYDVELTPLLGLLLEAPGPHEIGVGVNGAESYWLVTGNLHVWVDRWSDKVAAMVEEYRAPPLRVTRQAEWGSPDGSSEVAAEGLVRMVGWVSSSRGNLTTTVRQKVGFKSQVEVQNRGAVLQVEVVHKERMEVIVHKAHQVVGRVQIFAEAPLQIQTSRVTAAGGAVFEKGRLFHQLVEVVNLNENNVVITAALTDRQDAEGSVLMRDGMPIWGSGNTKSAYKYRDENTCHLRTVNSVGGIVKYDVSSPSCAAVSDI